MDRSNSTSWLVAGVLFIILVIVGFLWINTKRELQSVLAENKSEIQSQREVIAEKCQGAKADREECDEALAELADILREFDAELSTAATSTAE